MHDIMVVAQVCEHAEAVAAHSTGGHEETSGAPAAASADADSGACTAASAVAAAPVASTASGAASGGVRGAGCATSSRASLDSTPHGPSSTTSSHPFDASITTMAAHALTMRHRSPTV
jgi:hypothetical protein